MSKISLTNLVNLQNETTAVSAINSNNNTVTAAIDNTLSRDGTSPNQMNATLDMNSNRIINLPAPITLQEPLRLQDLNSFIGGGTIQSIPAGGTAGQVLTKFTNADYAADWESLGTNNTTIYAYDYGVRANTGADMSSQLQAAVDAAKALNGATVVIPGGTIKLANPIYYNQFTTTSALTGPGLKLRGAGKNVTILDSTVANAAVIQVNPAWKSAHKTLYGITGSTGGSLTPGATYWLAISMNDGIGNEIFVTHQRPITLTGGQSSIQIIMDPLTNPQFSYNVVIGTTSAFPTNYAIASGSNMSAIGGNQTLFITTIGSPHTVPVTNIANWQEARIQDLTITSSANTVGSSGILFFKTGYASVFEVNCNHLKGDGLVMPMYTGDSDGSFAVSIRNCKFDTIAGWGINSAGAALEFSNFSVDNCIFNICGTRPTNFGTNVTISSITSSVSNAVVTTSTNHNLNAGDQIAFNVTGITLAGPWYRVGPNVTATTFDLKFLDGSAVNTTVLGAFASGTLNLRWRPPKWDNTLINTVGSGGISWLGLIGTFRNLGFTQCENVGIYISENGSSDNATFEGIDFENTQGKSLYVGGLLGGSLDQCEILSTAGIGDTLGGIQLGTGMSAGGVVNFRARNIKVRNDVAPCILFESYPNILVGTYVDLNSVEGVWYQTYDAANQYRFSGFQFKNIAGRCKFSISSTNVARLIPIGIGSVMPMKLKLTGEWVEVHIPVAGVLTTVGPLAPTTTYNMYLANSAGLNLPFVGVIEASSTGSVIDTDGYSVKSGDPTRLFIGTAQTDGAGAFQVGGAQTTQYPAGP